MNTGVVLYLLVGGGGALAVIALDGHPRSLPACWARTRRNAAARRRRTDASALRAALGAGDGVVVELAAYRSGAA